MEREDGEMSDDDAMVVEDDTRNPVAENFIFKAEPIVLNTLDRVDAKKLEERAKCLGLNLTGNRIITQKQIDEFYMNFGIERENERHFRFDTLHLSGIDGLTTREIFEYLEDFKPVSLEWIDGNSCNIVCQDHITAALALLVHSREIRNEEIKNMISQSSTYHWREGMPHEKKDFTLMRFATNSDKKDCIKETNNKLRNKKVGNIVQNMESVIAKNPWGDLCESWGVHDHQEILNYNIPTDRFEQNRPIKQRLFKSQNLARRLGKRTYLSEESGDSSDSDSEWTKKQKAPRMRMHADDEEQQSKQCKKSVVPISESLEKDSFAPLSIEVINVNSKYTPKQVSKLSDKFKSHREKHAPIHKDTIHSRLGSRIAPADEVLTSDDNSDMSNHFVMSSVQKVSNTGKSDVWSRLDENTENSDGLDTHNDLRQILKSRKPRDHKKDTDLRSRIKSRDGVSLRVEIDNDYHIN